MTSRPSIPAELKRQVYVEAGHRCAIPTCRCTTIEIAHIIPWEKVHEHKFENLIALCPNCHTRHHNGQIDMKSILIYKKRLGFLSDKYSRFELDVLDELRSKNRVIIPARLFVKRLLDESLIEIEEEIMIQSFDDGSEELCYFSAVLAQGGKKFLEQWSSPDEVLIY